MAGERSVFEGMAQESTAKRLLVTDHVADVQARRRVDLLVPTHVNAATLTTGGTYTYGGMFPVDEFDEIGLSFGATSLVLGSGAGLSARIELCSAFASQTLSGAVWFPYENPGLTNPIALTAAAGTNVCKFTPVPSPFGWFMRIGLTCTTAFTSGSIWAEVMRKS
jgi:hypothetical protein